MKEAEWKPTVGKTAWMKYQDAIIEVRIDEIEVQDGQDKSFFEINGKEMVGWCRVFFPTSEAALQSIKVFDLEGKEVILESRAERVLNSMIDGRSEGGGC